MSNTITHEVGVWLTENVDSHNIYAASMLEQLKELGLGVRFVNDDRDLGTVSIISSPTKPQPLKFVLQSHAEAEQQIKARGLSGYLKPDTGEQLFTGWLLSSALCLWLMGYDPGATFHGRGSSHRACVDALLRYDDISAAPPVQQA